jgi:hypothetical protein
MPFDLDPHRPSLPPAEVVEIKAIRDALTAYHDANEQMRAAGTEWDAFQRRRGAAEQQDRELYADALSTRKGDPGTPATDAYDAKLKDLRRLYDARKLVRERAFADLLDTLNEHQAEWVELTEQREARAREELTESLDGVAQKVAAVTHAEAISRFASGRARGANLPKPGKLGGKVPLTIREGEATLDQLIDALRTLSEPPEPKPQGMVQP